MDVSQDLQDLLAERAIRAKLAQYCQGVDRKQWDLVRDCFHDDAIDSHGAYVGDRDGFLAFVQARHEHIGSSMHDLGTTTVTFSEDRRRARSEAYCMTYQNILGGADDPFAGSGGGSTWLTLGCRYVDTFEFRDGPGWRILRRTVVFEWIRTEDASSYQPLDPSWALFRRDDSDLVFSSLTDLSG
ncbi:nuclear transport factor 2 family protein [Baekduia soli]|uniref:Nuclear transport factor 2 family protein n=1 Tax=Baekduia soli TaxID=496014 RepID=A0A5B8U1E5_9ACTN|nr:nuclear transport factor 2 family protein [Baekduia soli]QEC46760.1 nuclear transport factor 2 family protein [Baekduia soli]